MLTSTLDNGLRVIVEHCPSAGVYMGLAVNAGTRDELPSESGMAHFTEHMTFKGTRRRSAVQIINRLECVGGELNAYTTKEETVYYCAVEPRYLDRGLELLTDIVFGSIYPEAEMRREAEVVIDEIESYNDSPSELIFDEFDTQLFGTHPLGRSILGEADLLRRHTTADMKAFADRLYTPGNMVLFVRGNIDEERLLTRINARIRENMSQRGTVACQVSRTVPAVVGASERTVEKNVHQAHVIIGTRSLSYFDPNRLTMVLLTNILGGPSLNSRLNLAMRERNGLVYTVESNYNAFTDCGVWTIYFGCDQKDVRRCRRIAAREMDRLMQAPLSARALENAKAQICGQLALTRDNIESNAIAMGKVLLRNGTYYGLDESIARLRAVTAPQLQDMAQRTFAPDGLSTLMYV
ncbi:MAG: insulinase family protein [Bacteroidaceae bacterium]|nr:insulinase family protein [Bacteroidaceae bacterium]